MILVLATMNERFRHCISMTKMLNSENLLADSGLDPSTTGINADRILYNYAMEQCQSAALDELFGNPGECFQVIFKTFERRVCWIFRLLLSWDECIILYIYRDTTVLMSSYMHCNIKPRVKKTKMRWKYTKKPLKRGYISWKSKDSSWLIRPWIIRSIYHVIGFERELTRPRITLFDIDSRCLNVIRHSFS